MFINLYSLLDFQPVPSCESYISTDSILSVSLHRREKAISTSAIEQVSPDIQTLIRCTYDCSYALMRDPFKQATQNMQRQMQELMNPEPQDPWEEVLLELTKEPENLNHKFNRALYLQTREVTMKALFRKFGSATVTGDRAKTKKQKKEMDLWGEEVYWLLELCCEAYEKLKVKYEHPAYLFLGVIREQEAWGIIGTIGIEETFSKVQAKEEFRAASKQLREYGVPFRKNRTRMLFKWACRKAETDRPFYGKFYALYIKARTKLITNFEKSPGSVINAPDIYGGICEISGQGKGSRQKSQKDKKKQGKRKKNRSVTC